ncbi:sperm-associated antigen 1 [Topomyia yanbarensis]|uniref:sperm-associated antigen 1 n=1 Tax=Topomyia yanbarensis TaxID=2498891 RepID=UPI00273BBAD8|nr:sperm-associated antigen 1 [Topomyia yanbarensis]
MSNKPKHLLEKYGLLLEHLDFQYIGQCTKEHELEKIVKVLRSGEEGHFPELMNFSEERLKTINPDNKLFRKEIPLGTRDSISKDRWEQINSDLERWENEMKTLHDNVVNEKDISFTSIPPVRGVYDGLTTGSKCLLKSFVPVHTHKKMKDYQEWDRYDPDTEILKMDLDEERSKDIFLNRNQKNDKGDIANEIQSMPLELTKHEKIILATKSKEKGNDYFRSKEYVSALSEYSNSIAMYPTAACFNNRAITYIKLFRFEESVSDCDACLKIEPNNVKALLRKAEALTMSDKRCEAYQVYCKVLIFDSANKLALNRIGDLRQQLPDLPPPNATLVNIVNVQNENDYPDADYAALIKPKNITKDRLPSAMKVIKNETTKLVQNTVVQNLQHTSIDILQQTRIKKPLIEEL